MADRSFIGADALLRVLQDEGVDVIFGFPGAAVIPIYDRLYDKVAAGLRDILPSRAGRCTPPTAMPGPPGAPAFVRPPAPGR